jgi:hypothetical protein
MQILTDRQLADGRLLIFLFFNLLFHHRSDFLEFVHAQVVVVGEK